MYLVKPNQTKPTKLAFHSLSSYSSVKTNVLISA